MSLFLAELRKVWGNRLFPLLLAVLAAANLLLQAKKPGKT